MIIIIKEKKEKKKKNYVCMFVLSLLYCCLSFCVVDLFDFFAVLLSIPVRVIAWTDESRE